MHFHLCHLFHLWLDYLSMVHPVISVLMFTFFFFACKMHLRIPLPLTFKYPRLCSSIAFALALLKLAKHRCISCFLRLMENTGPSYVKVTSAFQCQRAVAISLLSLRVMSLGQIISSRLLVFQEPPHFTTSPRSRCALEWVCLLYAGTRGFQKKTF